MVYIPSQLNSSWEDAASGTMTATRKAMTKSNRKRLVGETAISGQKTAKRR